MKPSTVTPELCLEYVNSHPGCKLAEMSAAFKSHPDTVRTRVQKIYHQIERRKEAWEWRFYPLDWVHKAEREGLNPMLTQLWRKGIDLEAA